MFKGLAWTVIRNLLRVQVVPFKNKNFKKQNRKYLESGERTRPAAMTALLSISRCRRNTLQLFFKTQAQITDGAHSCPMVLRGVHIFRLD